MVLLVALAAGGTVLPAPSDSSPDPSVAVEEPPVSICPVQEGSGRSTDVAVLSTVDGRVQLTLFAGGGAVGSLGTETGPSGSTVIPVGDVAAVGVVGGLIELPVASSAGGVRIGGAASLMAESCASVPTQETFVTAGSTVAGESFSVQLMNPYAGEAIVSMRVTSEAGVESSDRFDNVIVPPRSSIVVDFNTLIPARERISVAIETVVGRVIAVAEQGGEGDSSLWNSVPAAEDWYLPIPAGGVGKTLHLASPSAIAVDYQVDIYGGEGLEEAFVTGQLDPGGRLEIDLAEISQDASGARVIATGPVVPTLRVEAGSLLATTTGSTVLSNRWMLPGAGAPQGGWATVVILNPSLDDSTVSLRPLRERSSIRSLVVPSDGVIELGLDRADGYLIEATSPVAVLWTARNSAGGAMANGVPISDG